MVHTSYSRWLTLVMRIAQSRALRMGATSSTCWGAPSWPLRRSKLAIVALSSCEAEFMTAFEAAKRIMWVLRLLNGLQIEVKVPVPILEDNNAAIQLSRRPSLNSGHSRNMEVRWHWLQAQVEARQVRLTYLTAAWQVADLFTKAVNGSLFNRLSPLLIMSEEEINQGAINQS